ncbi:hypothetical protein DUI87_28363 [Hirundo rustica rustica]|uniref:CCHC-type domain-containing protein n=1 Tax=Hirundo rustica rustica TaxID=333673 RepID=A0A3M0J3J9_HIRRU|nr:hypothetical protein DUI87_28363 [Hirundo rustica rustica]
MTLGGETGSTFCTKKGQSQAKGVIRKERKGMLEFCLKANLARNNAVPFDLQKALLPELWQNPETAVDNKNLPIQLATQPNKSFQPYSKIKQLPSEPFVLFVERLTQAIELQVKNEGAQEQVLEEMALANANEQCKAAILSLSIEPASTSHDMLQVHARKIPFIKAHQSHSPRVKPPQKAAAADTMPPVPVPRPPPKRGTTCLLCDQAGHWASQCPLKKQFLDFWDNGGGKSQRSKGNFSKKIENVSVKLNNPASTSSAFQQKSPDMIVKDPATRETKSPHDQVTWGRGYTYVSTPPGLKWVPAEWVKPFIPKTAKPPAEAPQVACAAWRRRKR